MLADARNAYGMSQEQLGEAVGAAGRTVSTWETDVHMPTKRVQATLEAIYGWPVGTIAYANRTGGELPKVTTSFAPRPQGGGTPGATPGPLVLQLGADALELLAERLSSLEDRVSQLESRRAQRAR